MVPGRIVSACAIPAAHIIIPAAHIIIPAAHIIIPARIIGLRRIL